MCAGVGAFATEMGVGMTYEEHVPVCGAINWVTLEQTRRFRRHKIATRAPFSAFPR
jgi:hypothetical protein